MIHSVKTSQLTSWFWKGWIGCWRGGRPAQRSCVSAWPKSDAQSWAKLLASPPYHRIAHTETPLLSEELKVQDNAVFRQRMENCATSMNSLIISSHLSLNDDGCRGTIDDFATSFLHFSLFYTALWDFANSRPVNSLMLSSDLFLCLPCLLLICLWCAKSCCNEAWLFFKWQIMF